MTELQDFRGILVILSQEVGHREPESNWSKPFQTGWNSRRNPQDIPQSQEGVLGNRETAP
jgi:hypothetical protein